MVLSLCQGFPGGSVVKNLPSMQETWVWSLDWERPLAMSFHSNILVWRIPWTEEPAGLQSMGLQRVRHDWATSLSFTKIDEGFPASSNGKESTCNVGDPGQSLGQENPLAKEMVTHSSILVWRIPWTEEPSRLQPMGSQRVGHNLGTKPPSNIFILVPSLLVQKFFLNFKIKVIPSVVGNLSSIPTLNLPHH